ncbi:MAG TPA: trehalose-6-phosphate synthase [Patescibacteria group bacterium]|nr:trehalose-6-phosphate synthase [Patescibacteria group bacterium]
MLRQADIVSFFQEKAYKVIIASDAEPFVHRTTKQNGISTQVSTGGVGVALDGIARSSKATFIARGRTPEDKKVLDARGKVMDPTGNYVLKRMFFTDKELERYYYGFANQTLWPLCHIAYHRPLFANEWFDGFQKVNDTFAKAIKDEIRGRTFIWLNDYHMPLVPNFLGRHKDTLIGFFWHIPWPTWEIYRILPQRKVLLESLLQCDFIGFHRGYQARNFLQCVEQELEARIDLETNKVFYNKHVTTVKNLPLGIDTDVLKTMVEPPVDKPKIVSLLHKIFPKEPPTAIDKIFSHGKIILGVDRLDYTKGLLTRMQAIDLFFTKYPQYKRKVTHVELLALSREQIPAYSELRRRLSESVREINAKHQKGKWVPIIIEKGLFPREDIVRFYRKANVCLVTPLDDGMNLVSKEYVVVSGSDKEPGMLVLSRFAGSAIDLTDAVTVNPYNSEEIADAIKKALEMPVKEKLRRMQAMTLTLDDRNVHEWTRDFVRNTEQAAKENH